jgi:hypothetical protein
LRADPIGIQKGENHLFAYAQNNSIIFIDLNGLSVLASCAYTSGGQLLGAGALECSLSEIECTKNGMREKCSYISFFAGITAGIPVGRVHFSITFDSVSDVRDLEGTASISSTSTAIIGGVSWGQICLGKACSYGWTDQLGLDLSVDIFGGYGFVYDVHEECCY